MNSSPKTTMKRTRISFMLSCFLLLSVFCNAQDFNDRGYWSEIMNYRYVPIDSLWLFHPGTEQPSTAADNSWQTANTELLQNTTGKSLPTWGNGWYKKDFTVPADFRNKPVAFHMAHFGASEIFLDGKLIQRYGVVGTSIGNEKIFLPRDPIIIYLDSQQHHQLMVHYSNFHAAIPGYINRHIGFHLFISPTWVQINPLIQNNTVLPVALSIMLIFSIYFFFVWLFYPKRLASLFTLLWFLNFFVVLLSVYLTLTLNQWDALSASSTVGNITAVWLNFFLLLVIYALYYKGKMPRRSWLVVVCMILGAVAILNSYFALQAILMVVVFVELIRMFILGIRNKATGFWILLTGFIIQQLGLFLIVVDVFNWFPVYTPLLLLLQVIFPQLGIPLTYALHLAWEFRSANRDLRLQLTHVNELSQKNLVQEQEKQQILASQNDTLEKQVGERTAALNNSLTELKSTQAQLIQSEKMASLGELTAGIAHEIQNPLNFVKNFSEVNNELADEINAQNDIEEIKAIATDIKQNGEKILFHGRRADAIVKGMLQHSQTSKGQKELTDINKLADEYLRLADHAYLSGRQSLEGKDPSFEVTMKTNFDHTIERINIIPRDIGNVLFNLYNNAFYAVNEKKTATTGVGPENYDPTVSVSTKQTGNTIEVRIADNGNGIPQKITDKIFQPFFTTKPPGQGTGLGLSLAYDIAKANGGELKVETKEGEGAEFILVLPANIA